MLEKRELLAGDLIGLSGTVFDAQASSIGWQTVTFDQPLDDPIVVAGPMSTNDPDQANIRIRGVSNFGFQWQFDEYSDSADNAVHGFERFDYVAINRGEHTLPDGRRIVADSRIVSSDTQFVGVDGFDQTPAVFAQIASDAEYDPSLLRMSGSSSTGFDIRIDEEEGSDRVHTNELVNYLAIDQGAPVGSDGWDVNQTTTSVTSADYTIGLRGGADSDAAILAFMQTTNGGDPSTVRLRSRSDNGSGADSLSVFIEEEQTFDSELNHFAAEVVAYASLPIGEIREKVVLQGDVIGVSGTVVDDQPTEISWQTVTFDQPIDDPIVVAGPMSTNESDPANIRIRGVTNFGFQWQFDEYSPPSDNGAHAVERFDYVAIRRGRHTLPDGRTIVADSVQANHITDRVDVDGFESTPAVFAQIASDAEYEPTVVRISSPDSDGFNLRLDEQEGSDGVHLDETVHYLAMDLGAPIGPNLTSWDVGQTPQAVRHFDYTIDLRGGADSDAALLTFMQSDYGKDTASVRLRSREDQVAGVDRFTIFVEEEQSGDSETNHYAPEVVAYAALPIGTIRNRYTPPRDLIGLSGTVFDAQASSIGWQTVTFDQPLDDPIVVAGPMSTNDPDQANIRIRGVSNFGFQWQFDEYSDSADNAVHGFERFDYVAINRGEHTLPDGRRIVADSRIVSSDTQFVGVDGFDQTPAVFAQIASDAEYDPSLLRMSGSSSTGFDIRIDEEEGSDRVHTNELVNYLAIDQGAPVGSDGWDVNQTTTSVTSADYTIGLRGGADSDAAILAFMQTTNGGDPSTVRLRSRSDNGSGADSLSVFIEEEQTFDSELNHFAAEVVAYAALPLGEIRSTAPDVQSLGNPFFVGSTNRVYARNVWEIKSFGGKLYFGHGNSSNLTPEPNAGPVPLVTYTPEGGFQTETVIQEEQIDVFRVINGQLTIPGHDPRGFTGLQGTWYRLENGNWVTRSNLDINSTFHTYDMAVHDGKLYAALGGEFAIVASSDNGETFTTVFDEIPTSVRFHTFMKVGENFYASGAILSNDVNGNFRRFDFAKLEADGKFRLDQSLNPSVTFPGYIQPNQFGGRFIKHPVEFAGSTVFTGNDIVNDHQGRPFGLYAATGSLNNTRDLLVGSSQGMPFDVKVVGDELWVLTGKDLGDRWSVEVLRTRDLNEFTSLVQFDAPTFARSFELHQNALYFGLGSFANDVSPSTGEVLRVAL